MIRQRIAPTKTAWLSPARELAAEAEVARLPPNEAAVVRMHFGLGERPRTIVETAAARGLSAGQVRRLQACALKRLRWRSWAAEEVAES